MLIEGDGEMGLGELQMILDTIDALPINWDPGLEGV